MSIYSGGFNDIDSTAYPALTSVEASATANTTVISTTYSLLNSMTLTPVAGKYLVQFSTSFINSSNGSDTFFSVYAGGVQIAHSERRGTSLIAGIVIGNSPNAIPVSTQCYVTVDGTQSIEIRARREAGTSTVYQRTLTLLKVANL